MNETTIPDSNAIAGAMLKRTGEIIREQRAADPAQHALADKVISTLTRLRLPGWILIDSTSLDALAGLLKAAEAEKAKPAPALRLASYFANEAPEGEKPRYAEVGKEFHGDPDVYPLYFAPSDSHFINEPARLTLARISELWNGMPGGRDGFLKQWGYCQFAEAVEAEVRATLLAALSPTVSDEPEVANQRSGLTPESLAEEMFDAAIHYSNGHVTDFRERAERIFARNAVASARHPT